MHHDIACTLAQHGEALALIQGQLADLLSEVKSIARTERSQGKTLAKLQTEAEANVLTLDDLKTKVDKLTTVGASGIELLKGLAAQIEANKNDPVKMQELADALDKDAADWTDAIVANTPAATP